MIRALESAGVLDALDAALGRRLPTLVGCDDPHVGLAIALASRALAAGDVAVDLRRIHGTIDALAPAVSLPATTRWIEAVGAWPALFRGPSDPTATPLVLHDGLVYLDRAWRDQEDLVRAVVTRAQAPDHAAHPRLDADLSHVEDPDHAAAIRMIVTRPLAMITGGPGTGKTTLVARALAILHAQAAAQGDPPPRTVCLAPTGKAAARMTEALATANARFVPERLRVPDLPVASTVHRGLGYVPRRGFRRDRDDPIDADVVVVDEASMVDLRLMVRLFDAVPATARLVLLGDPDQLASVEHGAVLADLVAALGAPHHVRLGTSHRFADHPGIGAVAQAVRRGDAATALDVLRDPAHPEVRWLPATTDGEVHAAVKPLAVDGYADLARLSAAEALDRSSRFRLLTPHRRGPRGVEGLVARVQRWLAEAGHIEVDGEWFRGRPAMIVRNDPDLGVFNGDVAIVAPHGETRAAWVAGPGGTLRALPPGGLPDHETAYAATVHKSQGSEYDHVALVLPAQPSPVCTRELVYTAITRARSQVTVVGSAEVFAASVARRTERVSGLRQRIADRT